MKTSKSIIVVAFALCGCGVQHFNVNTSNYGEKWKVFGEKTSGKVIGKEVVMGSDIFVFGVNVSQTDTKSMAEQMQATSYTIETKINFLSVILSSATFGVVSYKRVKVIKR